MNRPCDCKEDNETTFDWIFDILKDLLYAIGLIAFGAALALGAVYFATQAKEPSVTTPDCGSKFCKDKESK